MSLHTKKFTLKSDLSDEQKEPILDYILYIYK